MFKDRLELTFIEDEEGEARCTSNRETISSE
jgi:hypothetical protein